jgi:hypothetical protein
LGTALLCLQEPRAAYYYYAFYDLEQRSRSLGMFMMTWAVGFFASRGIRHLYLGTCYSDRALYKTQFLGVEFFNGNSWTQDLAQLKHLLNDGSGAHRTHLLQDAEYLQFLGGDLVALADQSRCRVQLPLPNQPFP